MFCSRHTFFFVTICGLVWSSSVKHKMALVRITITMETRQQEKLVMNKISFLSFCKKDAASNISLSPESEDNEYCTGDVLTVTFSSNPAAKQFIWYIWNNEAWEVHILQGQIRIKPVIFHGNFNFYGDFVHYGMRVLQRLFHSIIFQFFSSRIELHKRTFSL